MRNFSDTYVLVSGLAYYKLECYSLKEANRLALVALKAGDQVEVITLYDAIQQDYLL